MDAADPNGDRVMPEPHATFAVRGADTCSFVAVRRMLSPVMTGNITTLQEERRPEAALVYRDSSCPDRWLVGAPEHSPPREQAFTGPNACQAALEFAHRTYGSARYFAL